MPSHPWLMRCEQQLPSQLREHLVGLAAVTRQAGRYEVLPGILPASAARNYVVDGVSGFSAVGAAEVVSTKNAPTGHMIHVPVGASHISF